MAKRESYGPQRSPFKIFLYIVIIVLLLGGIAYLVKCTRVKQAAFQEQIRELGAQETEFVQKKQTVQEESETETKKSIEKATAQTEKKETSTEAETEKAAEGTSESETESETGSENVKNSTAIQKQHILLLNGSGKDRMAARWQARLMKAGYTNVSVASFPGQAIERTRIYVEREEEKEELTDLKAQFAGVEVTTEPFSTDITLEDGTTPKDVDLYIIIGKNDAAE